MAKKKVRKKARKGAWQGEIYVDHAGMAWIIKTLESGSTVPHCIGLANELTDRQRASFGWHSEI